jgi:hypothetical protein
LRVVGGTLNETTTSVVRSHSAYCDSRYSDLKKGNFSVQLTTLGKRETGMTTYRSRLCSIVGNRRSGESVHKLTANRSKPFSGQNQNSLGQTSDPYHPIRPIGIEDSVDIRREREPVTRIMTSESRKVIDATQIFVNVSEPHNIVSRLKISMTVHRFFNPSIDHVK